MSSPPPLPPQHTPIDGMQPICCCHCGSPLNDNKGKSIASNASIVYQEDMCHCFCSKTCKEECIKTWTTACSFSSRSFPIDGVLGYTVRSPIPIWYKDMLGVVAFSPYAPEDKQNVFISVDGETRIPLPPTPCLP
jgi:hypothetical protein